MDTLIQLPPGNIVALPDNRCLVEIRRIRTALVDVRSLVEADDLSQRAYAMVELAERSHASDAVKIEAAKLVVWCERAVGQALGEAKRAGRPSQKLISPQRTDFKIANQRVKTCRLLAKPDDSEFQRIINAVETRSRVAMDRVSRWLSVRKVSEEIRGTDRPEAEISPIIKPTNNWNFSPPVFERKHNEGFGYIPGDVYANCLWYWAHRSGARVVAPMAGSGMIRDVYEQRMTPPRDWMRPSPWELELHLFDLNPQEEGIGQNDLVQQFPMDHADYIVMDLPYFRIVAGQYSDDTADLANMDRYTYSVAVQAIARNCAGAQSPGAFCTVIVPDYFDTTTRSMVLVTDIVRAAFEATGYRLAMKVFSSRGTQRVQSADMARMNHRAKLNRTMLIDITEIMTFERETNHGR